MGSLKPGAKYIYEKVNGITYAREFNAPHSERFEIGRDFEMILKDEWRLWEEIVRAGRTNQALQEVLDRAKILHHLSKDHG
jgi:prephenate dehydrogenase